MNKFEPPLGGKSADPEDGVHRGYEQAQAGQRAPASFSGGEPAPPKPNYGTFFRGSYSVITLLDKIPGLDF